MDNHEILYKHHTTQNHSTFVILFLTISNTKVEGFDTTSTIRVLGHNPEMFYDNNVSKNMHHLRRFKAYNLHLTSGSTATKNEPLDATYETGHTCTYKLCIKHDSYINITNMAMMRNSDSMADKYKVVVELTHRNGPLSHTMINSLGSQYTLQNFKEECIISSFQKLLDIEVKSTRCLDNVSVWNGSSKTSNS
jgi:hypothetical protein